MSREFMVSSQSATTTTGLTVLGASTLVALRPPAAPNFSIWMLRHWAGQAANATSAQQRIAAVTQPTTFPTVVSITPVSVNKADPNVSVIAGGTALAAGTCGVNASAEGAGTKAFGGFDETFNVLNGFLNVPTPDEVIKLPNGFASSYGFWFPTAPATLTGWNFGFTYAER